MSPARLVARGRRLLRRYGPGSPLGRRRLAMGIGAVTIGLAALAFAAVADAAGGWFTARIAPHRWLTLLLTPLGFVLIVAVTRRYAPAAAGSGIPQVIAAQHRRDGGAADLLSPRVALLKLVATVAGLACGASVGREGPTVQVAAAILAVWHRLFRVRLQASVAIAGGAAGVAAAFNTPLAGVTFAIEELADAYEQRIALLIMTTIVIAGVVSLGLSGDYVYFGVVGSHMAIGPALAVAPVAGVAGGLTGGLFARALLGANAWRDRHLPPWLAQPVVWALACGLVVAALGIVTGMTWGTGYGAARALIDGSRAPVWFGPAKFAATLATAASGVPGGIFAPSLATGAGLGAALRQLFPAQPADAVVLLGTVAYFTGVVRAPLTAVIIVVEATSSRGLILPLFAAALIAYSVSALVCRERLYHGLARRWRAEGREPATRPSGAGA